MEVDAFDPRLSFFFAIGMNFFMEAAKLRAARLLWHRIMAGFGAQKAESLMLRTHCQRRAFSLQEQDPYNNVVRRPTRRCRQSSAAPSRCTPTRSTRPSRSHRIRRPHRAETQLILQEETGITKVVDPLAGSYYVETLTHELAEAAWALMEEVEQLGGMTKAVMSGMPKLRIEESAPVVRP